MSKTVADQFIDVLVAADVKRIYRVVGDSLNGLADAMRRNGKIDWVHVRHEEVAAFAAGAEAHMTGSLTATCCSCSARTSPTPSSTPPRAPTLSRSTFAPRTWGGVRRSSLDRFICIVSMHDRMMRAQRKSLTRATSTGGVFRGFLVVVIVSFVNFRRPNLPSTT